MNNLSKNQKRTKPIVMWKLANSNRNWHHSRWDKRLEHPANEAEEPSVENGKTNKNQVQDAEDSPSNFEGKMQ